MRRSSPWETTPAIPLTDPSVASQIGGALGPYSRGTRQWSRGQAAVTKNDVADAGTEGDGESKGKRIKRRRVPQFGREAKRFKEAHHHARGRRLASARGKDGGEEVSLIASLYNL